jgi:TATA-binding protein-associated factor Taf7
MPLTGPENYINKQKADESHNPFHKRFFITLHTKDGKTYALRLPDIGPAPDEEAYVNPGSMIVGSILLEDEMILRLLNDHKIDHAVLKYERDSSGEYVLRSPL